MTWFVQKVWSRLRAPLRGAVGGTVAFVALLGFVLVVPLADPPPAEGRPQAISGIAYFDGASALRLHDALPERAPYTVECWARGEGAATTQFLLGDKYKGGFGLALRTTSPRLPHPNGWVSVDDVPGVKRPGYIVVESPTEPADGAWHHYALVVDHEQVRFYVDGVCRSRRSYGGGLRGSPHDVFVGARPDSRGRPAAHFVGEMDDVRISAVARYDRDFAPPRRMRVDAHTTTLLTFEIPGNAFLRNAASPASRVLAYGKPQWRERSGRLAGDR